MNTEFRKTGIGRAENAEGAVVRGSAPELLVYKRQGYQIFIEINFLKDHAVIYKPTLIGKLPVGFFEKDLLAEILAGATVVARRRVVWAT